MVGRGGVAVVYRGKQGGTKRSTGKCSAGARLPHLNAATSSVGNFWMKPTVSDSRI